MRATRYPSGLAQVPSSPAPGLSLAARQSCAVTRQLWKAKLEPGGLGRRHDPLPSGTAGSTPPVVGVRKNQPFLCISPYNMISAVCLHEGKTSSFSFINVPASRVTHFRIHFWQRLAASVTVFTWAPWAKVLTLPAERVVHRGVYSLLPGCQQLGQEPLGVRRSPLPPPGQTAGFGSPRHLKAGVHAWRGSGAPSHHY